MNLSTLQYLSDQQGHTTGVVVPIDVWRDIQQLLGNFPSQLPQAAKITASLQETEEAPLIQKGGVWIAQVIATDDLEMAIQDMRLQRNAIKM